jgi:RNA polymerase sigma factor (sigma-70 family)
MYYQGVQTNYWSTEIGDITKVKEFDYHAELALKCLQELPVRQQEALRMLRFDNKSYEEIAEVLKVSKNTVKTNLRVGVRNVRRLF